MGFVLLFVPTLDRRGETGSFYVGCGGEYCLAGVVIAGMSEYPISLAISGSATDGCCDHLHNLVGRFPCFVIAEPGYFVTLQGRVPAFFGNAVAGGQS
jgi:hypothetical protein